MKLDVDVSRFEDAVCAGHWFLPGWRCQVDEFLGRDFVWGAEDEELWRDDEEDEEDEVGGVFAMYGIAFWRLIGCVRRVRCCLLS